MSIWNIVIEDYVNQSEGSPLDSETKKFMESSLDYDFSNVRIHRDSRAAESARSVNALAYTVGQDIIFGSGQYAPETNEGQRLLAHELTHVLQQTVSDSRCATGSDERAAHSSISQYVRVKPGIVQRQPKKIGPAADIKEYTERPPFLERGYFTHTEHESYLVRAGGPGAFGDHLFSSAAEAKSYARNLANLGEAEIRTSSAILPEWNRVYKVPPNTPYISGVAGPQPPYPGGGPQVQIPSSIRFGGPVFEIPVSKKTGPPPSAAPAGTVSRPSVVPSGPSSIRPTRPAPTATQTRTPSTTPEAEAIPTTTQTRLASPAASSSAGAKAQSTTTSTTSKGSPGGLRAYPGEPLEPVYEPAIGSGLATSVGVAVQLMNTM